MIALGVLLGVLVLVVALMYNGFISRRNRLRNGFAAMDVQLKKRWDLVPRLVETVRGYASHEQELFERVTRARRGIELAESAGPERFSHEQDLGAGVARVMLLAEDYPELKAGEQSAPKPNVHRGGGYQRGLGATRTQTKRLLARMLVCMTNFYRSSKAYADVG